MRNSINTLCLAIMSTVTVMTLSAAEEKRAWAVATFECLGLYYPSDADQGDCIVQYRQADEQSWRQALPLVYDSRRKEYRASLVGLRPDTEYLIRLTCGDQTVEFSHQDSNSGMIIKTWGPRKTLTVNGEQVPCDRGRQYIFHSTALQPNGALSVFNCHGVSNAVSKNNIFRVRGDTYPSASSDGPPNDFRNDLADGYLAGGFVRSMFVPSDRLEWFLAATVPSIKWGKVEFPRGDKGVRLPGFNDDSRGSDPDIGAFENGNPPLRFGREGETGFTRAPWEKFWYIREVQ